MAAIVPLSEQFVVSIGEILWDVVGNQRFVGGAPFNFAYNCQALGAKTALISRVCNDDLGADLIHQAESVHVNSKGIQRGSDFPTGMVTATTDSFGYTYYEFPQECAWDHIRFNSLERDLIDFATLVNFGTLAQRSPGSRSSIMAAMSSLPAKAVSFLDLNLRAPYYSREILSPSLRIAHMVKLNESELQVLRELYQLSDDDEAAVHQLMDRFEVDTVVLTRGPNGASAWSGHDSAHVAGYNVAKIADTVGCGDAFAAAFAIRLMSGVALTDALEAANLAGAFLATQPGATPLYCAATLQEFHLNNYRQFRSDRDQVHLPRA